MDPRDITGRLQNIGRNIPSHFIETITLTRPNNARRYAVNDVINGDGLTLFHEIDLSKNQDLLLKNITGQIINITGLAIFSSYGTARRKLAPIVIIFNKSNIFGSVQKDNVLFNPSFDEIQRSIEATISPNEFNQTVDFGSNVYKLSVDEIERPVKLSQSKKFFVGLLAGNRYRPKRKEIIKLTIKGKIT